MASTFAVTFPFFALVLCGYLAARGGVLPESAIPGLNAFVLFFALPCLLFRFGASMPFAELIDPWLLLVYAACAVAVVALAIAVTRRHETRKDAAFGALVAAFPNTGFMGVPLLVALLGAKAAGPVITTVLVDLVLTSSLCIALAEAHAARGPSGPSPLGRALRGAAANPLPWAIALGALLSASGRVLPGPVDQAVRMLAEAASPAALFTIGAVLWRAGQHAHTRTAPGRFMPVALIKLFVHPALVLAAGLALRAAGAPVPGFGLAVLVLAAALPSASNVSMLAERYGADNGRVARIILASTVLSALTFPLLVPRLRPLLGQ